MKEQYINERIEELDKAKEKKLKIKKLRSIGCTMASSFLLVLGACCVIPMPALGLACLGSGSVLGYTTARKSKETLEIIDRMDKEKKHLQKINTSTPKNNNDLNTRRRTKINELKRHRKQLVDKEKTTKNIYRVGSVVTLASSLASLISPVFAIGTVAGLTTTILSGRKLNKQIQEEQTDINRINNLSHDLNVITLENQPTVNNTTTTTRTNIPRRTRNHTRSKDRGNTNLVDEYVERLATMKDEIKDKIKVKK